MRYKCYRCGKPIKNPVEEHGYYVTGKDITTECIEEVYDVEYKVDKKVHKKRGLSLDELEAYKSAITDISKDPDSWKESIRRKTRQQQGTGLIHKTCVREGDLIIW